MRRGRTHELRLAALSLALLVLTGCGVESVRPNPPESAPVPGPTAPSPGQDGFPAPGTVPPRVAETPNAVPKVEPRSPYGNPPSYQVFGKTYRVRDSAKGFTQVGYASWYGRKFQGQRTASGEPYDMFKMTAAHKTLPIPSYVKVTNLRNNKTCVVRVNDRGPFHKGRVIDLSYAAAAKLGMLHHGSTRVKLQVVEPVPPTSPTRPPDAPVQVASAKPVALGADPPPAPADGRFLQVGLFLERDNAEALRDALQGKGIKPLKLAPTSYRGTPATRVLVGPFRNEVALQAMRQRLDADHVVSEPVSIQ